MKGSSQRTHPAVAPLWFGFAALALIVATLRLHIVLPMWDHIDLVPIYQAWQNHTLASSAFWQVHDGSHLHASAYAVLLLTTYLSNGQPWLDCLVSALLLCISAALLLRMARQVLPQGLGWPVWAILGLLAFYPGHLINLQWGWQVAIFISVLGLVTPVCLLGVPTRQLGPQWLALAAATLGALSFATTFAVFPVAIMLVLRNRELGRVVRSLLVLAWSGVLVALLMWMRNEHAGEAVVRPAIGSVVHYAWNYLASGAMHFSQAGAGFWLLVALVAAGYCALRGDTRRVVPCLALMATTTGAAVLTALGRAGPFGAEHGFMIRYVSYSVLFWFGWMVLVAGTAREQPRARAWLTSLLVIGSLIVCFNALHLGKKAMGVKHSTDEYARRISSGAGVSDPQLLRRAYGDRAEVAGMRLEIWRGYGFAPFGARPDRADASQPGAP